MFGINKDSTKDTYNVESHNQKGGITAGKIDNVINIIADKESIGIREPDGLYQNGKKVGKVINFNVDKTLNTFTISEIQFDRPLRDDSSLWQPYEFKEYVIQIKTIGDLVALAPPGARDIHGIIISKN